MGLIWHFPHSQTLVIALINATPLGRWVFLRFQHPKSIRYHISFLLILSITQLLILNSIGAIGTL